MNARVKHSNPAAEPLAVIVAELARGERRSRRLADEGFVEGLEKDEERSPPEELRDQLRDKRTALHSLASHIQASTPDGMTLQALIALAAALPEIEEVLPADFPMSPEGRRYNDARARVQRLLYSIIYARDDLGEDLRLLRDAMAPRGFHAIAQAEELDAPSRAA